MPKLLEHSNLLVGGETLSSGSRPMENESPRLDRKASPTPTRSRCRISCLTGASVSRHSLPMIATPNHSWSTGLESLTVIVVLVWCLASPAISRADEFPTAPTTRYFSAAGRAYARKHHLLPPPFQRGTAAIVDPPRDVAAPDWHGSFCGKWTDECTTCERDVKTGRPSCKPASDVRSLAEANSFDVAQRAKAASECIRRSVKCAIILPLKKFARVCWLSSWNIVERRPGQPEQTVFTTQSSTSWFLSRRDHSWNLSVEDGGDLPGRLDSRVEYRGSDVRCIQAVGEGNRDENFGSPLVER